LQLKSVSRVSCLRLPRVARRSTLSTTTYVGPTGDALRWLAAKNVPRLPDPQSYAGHVRCCGSYLRRECADHSCTHDSAAPLVYVRVKNFCFSANSHASLLPRPVNIFAGTVNRSLSSSLYNSSLTRSTRTHSTAACGHLVSPSSWADGMLTAAFSYTSPTPRETMARGRRRLSARTQATRRVA
jgi:hypothetical protein